MPIVTHDRFYIASSTGVFYWDSIDNPTSLVAVGPFGKSCTCISVRSSRDIWVGRYADSAADPPEAWHWDGTSWTRFQLPLAPQANGVWHITAIKAWADGRVSAFAGHSRIGGVSQGQFCEYDGVSAWTQKAWAPASSFSQICGNSADDLYVSTATSYSASTGGPSYYGGIRHWNGAAMAYCAPGQYNVPVVRNQMFQGFAMDASGIAYSLHITDGFRCYVYAGTAAAHFTLIDHVPYGQGYSQVLAKNCQFDDVEGKLYFWTKLTQSGNPLNGTWQHTWDGTTFTHELLPSFSYANHGAVAPGGRYVMCAGSWSGVTVYPHVYTKETDTWATLAIPSHAYEVTYYEYTVTIDEVRVPIGTCYVDHLEYLNPGDSADGDVINRIPSGSETDVYRYGPVYFQAVAYQNAALDSNLTVTITPASTGVSVLVYDQAAGGFQAGYTGTATVRQSPGAAVDDELVISFVPDVAFASLDVILVDIAGSVSGFTSFSASYSFTIEDYTAPDIEDILWLTPRRCRVKFNEPMDVTGNHTSSLFYRYYNGGANILDEHTVLLPGASLSADWVGLRLGIAGSAYPCNNGFHPITAIDTSARQVTVSSTLKVDNGMDYNEAGLLIDRRALYAAITPYVFTARLAEEGATEESVSAERVQCTYLPIVTKVEAVTAAELPSGEDPEQYAYLTVFDDISINRLYTIAGYHAEDKWENAMDGESLDWTAPAFEHPDNRMSLWHPGIVPTPDQQDDLIEGTGQLRKMAVVLNDALNQLWYRSLMVQYTNDPFRCPEHLLDDLLYDLANPFRFPLTTPMLKRKLAWALPELYKRVGTRRGIKDAIYKVLGILCTIQTYLHQDAWILGTSKLGTETILAPSTTFMKNCYEILAPRALTDAEVRIIRDIAQWADPPVMHLVRIIENITGGATYAVTYVSSYQMNTQT